MKRSFFLTVLTTLCLMSCLPEIENTPTASLPTQTSVISIPLTSTPEMSPQSEQSITPSVSVSPDAIPTQETIPIISPTPKPDITPTTESLCLHSEPELVESTPLANGLILRGTGDKTLPGLGVIGDMGLAQLLFLQPYPNNQSFAQVSPDGQWVAFITFRETVSEEEYIYSIDLLVRGFNDEREFQASYDNLALSRYSSIQWINSTRIVIPLKIEEERYQWLVWSPFTGDDELLSVELTGIGGKLEELRWAPLPDPRVELVAYVCDLCEEVEYRVKDIESGEIIWAIDLGPLLGVEHLLPVSWSPNGEYLAVSQALNPLSGEREIWIFNRIGKKLYSIPLPNVEGRHGGGLQSWSPNSQYVLTSRYVVTENGTKSLALSYIDIGNGKITDMCLDLFVTSPIWSPDSLRFASNQQIEPYEQPRMISIVEIQSGHVTQLYNPDAYELEGWIVLDVES